MELGGLINLIHNEYTLSKYLALIQERTCSQTNKQIRGLGREATGCQDRNRVRKILDAHIMIIYYANSKPPQEGAGFSVH